jgi:hypothetical protein
MVPATGAPAAGAGAAFIYHGIHHRDEDHDDHGGLHRDLIATASDRRGLFRLAARFGAGVGVLQLAACGGDSNPVAPTTTSSSTTTTSGGACSRIPEETAGPYPGDGSNVLRESGVVRQDIRSSFAGLSGVAEGVLLTIELRIVSSSTCEVLAGRAVYLWHCDRAGRYSLYSSGVTNQNYTRGVQQADAGGKVTFTPRRAWPTRSRPRRSRCQVRVRRGVCDQWLRVVA